MHTERRAAHKRIDVSRPVELIGPAGTAVSGDTRNLSESGLCVRFEDIAPDRGANVLVRLFLEGGMEPVEKPGRIVWCAPDIYGDGTEVGLRLLDGDEEEQPDGESGEEEQRRRAVRPEAGLVEEGGALSINIDGVARTARVLRFEGPDDEGLVRAVLELLDDGGEEDEIDPEKWTPHPFRDAWRATSRRLGPAFSIAGRLLSVAGNAVGRGARLLWGRLPAGLRARLSRTPRLVAPARRLLGRLSFSTRTSGE